MRLLALFDMAFSLMHAMADMWPAAIATVMSYSGYLGARLFRRDLTRVYLIYLTLFALARVALAVHFFMAPLPGTPARPARPSRYGVAPLITRLLSFTPAPSPRPPRALLRAFLGYHMYILFISRYSTRVC